MAKILLRVFLNTLIGVVLIFVWLKFVNINEILTTLKTVKLELVGLFFFFVFLSTIFRGLRLKLLLTPIQSGLTGFRLSSVNLIALNFMAQLLSFFIPVRAGEITKSVYLSTQHALPFGKSVVWIFIDRFLDFFGVLLILSLLLFITPNNLGDITGFVVFGILVAFTSIALLSVKSQSKAKALFLFLSKLLVFKKLQKIFLSVSNTVIEGFLVLKRDKKDLGGLTILTILALISDSLVWYFSFLSLGENIGMFKAVLGTQLSALTFLVPAAPGYVGSLEASNLAVWSLGLGLGENIVSATSVLFHILTILGLLVFGVASIYFLKFNLKLVWKKIR